MQDFKNELKKAFISFLFIIFVPLLLAFPVLGLAKLIGIFMEILW